MSTATPPPPPPHIQTLTSLRTTCLNLLLAHQQLQQTSTSPPFSRLTIPPKPILPQLTELTHEEVILLETWKALKEVTYQRLLTEAWVELGKKGKLVSSTEDDDEDEDEAEEKERERVLDQRIREVEQEVARLKLNETIKEQVAISAVTAREVSYTVYGVTKEAAAPSIVKSLALRSLLHHHTTATLQSTSLHAHLTILRSTLQKLQSQHLAQTTENRLLTTRLLSLTNQLCARSQKERIADPALRERVEESEQALKTARMRWEVARNVFQGVVAASGVDWVRAEEGRLRELMLEAGEEIE